MVQTPGLLVCALLLFVLMNSFVVLKNPLVMSVAWGLVFLSQQESSQLVKFSVGCVCTKRSRVQRRSTHRNILAPKILILLLILKISFVTIVLF